MIKNNKDTVFPVGTYIHLRFIQNRIPFPLLPVLSAISCSNQSPKDPQEGGRIRVSLSRPYCASVPRAAPKKQPVESPLPEKKSAFSWLATARAFCKNFIDLNTDQCSRDHAHQGKGRITATIIRVVGKKNVRKLKPPRLLSSIELPSSVINMKCSLADTPGFSAVKL